MGKSENELRKMEKDLRKQLQERLRINEPMSRHTTIGTGGKARLFALPRNAGEIVSLVRYAYENDLEYLVTGRGSNLLVRDGGFNGLIIKIAGNFSKIRINARTVSAEAGASLSLLARKTIKLRRTGLEFAVGIPGSVGGAVRMNAGAYGGEIASVLNKIRYVDKTGRMTTMSRANGTFGYRRSNLARSATVLSACFSCPPGRINNGLLKQSLGRKRTQPLEYRSFGSTFINPPGHHAGRLIEKCGLKGRKMGGAVISDKHANFILNVGPHTRTRDIEELMRLARTEVKNKFGIELRPEVIIVGNK